METGGERLPSENKYSRTSMPQLSDSNRRVSCSYNDRPDLRLYQAWKGSNVFCLGGRFIFGPDVRSLFFTVSLIVAPVAIFCAFVAPRLVNEFPHHLGHLIVAISAVFTAYVALLLFLTSARDPGIIPRNPHPPEDDGSTLSADWPGILGAGPTLPPTKDVMVNGVVIKVKYCQTCMLYRPPRCSHCSICNNCVERFDHHCPWVGQCIGKRNYRFFFMFVSSTTMLCLYVFAFCWVNIRKIMDSNKCNLWTAFLKSPITGILILYTFVSAWFVGGLTAFHLYLIFTNQTTYENFRYHYNRKTNPFNRGCIHNTVEIFFSKIPKSKNNFREKVKADSSSVCSMTMTLGHALNPWMPESNFDVEVGKRQAAVDEDFEDIQSQIENVSGLDRCRAQPGHTNLDHKANGEVTPDMRILAAELEMEHGSTYRQKISGDD